MSDTIYADFLLSVVLGVNSSEQFGLRVVRSMPGNGDRDVELNSGIYLELSSTYDIDIATHLRTQGSCRGSVQLSSDNFFTCLGVRINTRGNPALSIMPTTNLRVNQEYKLRISTVSQTDIITFRTRSASSEQRFIHGTVIDSNTGSPLGLVQVTTIPPTVPVVTDAMGRFEISENLNPIQTYSVRFQRAGYITRILSILPVSFATYAAVVMTVGAESVIDNSSGTFITDNSLPGGTGEELPILISEPTKNPPSGGYARIFHEGEHYAISIGSGAFSYKWNSSTGSWNQILNTTPSSTTTHGASAVICGSRIFVYGSGMQAYHPNRFNPNQSWFSVTSTGAPTNSTLSHQFRLNPTLVCSLDNSSVFVFGGSSSNWNLLDGGRFHFATGTWSDPVSVTNVPANRGSATVIAIPEVQKILIWGGCLTAGSTCTANTQTGAIYDLTNGIWTHTPLSGAPTSRKFSASGGIGRFAVIWGGFGTSSMDTGAVFDTETNAWIRDTSLVNSPTERYFNTGILPFRVVSGNLIVTGGWGPTGTSFVNDRNHFHYIYNLQTDSWSVRLR